MASRPSLLPTIFERFRQADTSSTRQHEGLGFGLSITKYIVDHLGGTISADSEGPGLGACFSVRLPLAGARRADAAVEIMPGVGNGAESARAVYAAKRLANTRCDGRRRSSRHRRPDWIRAAQGGR